MGSPPPPSGTALPRGIDGWGELALAELGALPDVLRAGVALSEGGGRRLLFTASDRPRTPGLDWCHVDAFAAVPLNDAIRTAEPVVGALDALDARYAVFAQAQHGTGHVAIATLPFLVDGRGLGGFVLYYGRVQPFGLAQRGRLVEIAADLARRLEKTLRQAPGPVVRHAVPVAGSLVAEHTIPPDPAAVTGARRFLRHTLDDWDVDEETAADAELCLSELVTNAVIHTTGGCHVRVELRDGVLTSRVHDNGTAIVTGPVASHDHVRAHGHGLRVVEALSHRWGRHDDPHGAEVWFALEVS